MRFKYIYLISAVLFMAIVVAFVLVAPFGDVATEANIIMKNYAGHNPILAALIFFGLAAFSAMLSPLSSVVLIPTAVSIWGTVGAGILLLLGWLSGGVFSYTIGRFVGYEIVIKIIASNKVDRWLDQISKQATPALAFLFRLATPSETGYIFGLIKYSFLRYVLITFLAELPFVFVSIRAGQALLAKDLCYFLVWIACTVLLIYLLERYFKKKMI